MKHKAKQPLAHNQPRGTKSRDPLDASEVSELVPVTFMGRAVLVVEADPEVQAKLARNLSRRGNRVVGTGSGDGALALISQWDVDLVLVSDVLPGRSGMEVARLIHQACPNAAVVLMADTLEPATRLAARTIGITDCVRKPVSEDQLGYLLRLRSSPHNDRDAVAQ